MVESTGSSSFAQRGAEFPSGFLIAFTHVDKMQLRSKAVANALRFGQNLHETGRERAGHGHGPIRWIDHLFREPVSRFASFGNSDRQETPSVDDTRFIGIANPNSPRSHLAAAIGTSAIDKSCSEIGR